MTRRGMAVMVGAVVLVLAGCAPESHVDNAATATAGTAIGASPATSPTSAMTRPQPSTPPPASPSEVMTMPDALVPVSSDPTGNLGFHDQVSDGWQLVGAAEIDGSGGWVVVRADRGGLPGRVIWSVYRLNEAHDDVVTVRLAKRVGSEPLWVSLHVDAGTAKRLDFPGPDLATRLVLTVL